MYWLIPVVCAVISAGCIVAGVLPVLRARADLQTHADRLQAALPVVLLDPRRLEGVAARIDADVEALHGLITRLTRSGREIAIAIEELRLREAMIALRVAAAAVRALRF
jgi:hypothetical protein